MTNIDPADITALKLLARGRNPEWVANATGKSASKIEQVGRAHGWPDLPQLRAQLESVGEHDTLPTGPRRPTSAPTLTTVPASRPSVTTTTITPQSTGRLELLLARAEKHDTAPVRAARALLLKTLARMESTLHKIEDKSRATAQAEAGKAAARSRVEQLEKQLKDARAALRGKPATTTSTPPKPRDPNAATREPPAAAVTRRLNALGVASRTVRTWAKENDVPVPDTGCLPHSTIDAYEAAHNPKGQTA